MELLDSIGEQLDNGLAGPTGVVLIPTALWPPVRP